MSNETSSQPAPPTRTPAPDGQPTRFLVVVDDTPECDRALIYAARRASKLGCGVTLLAVVRQDDFAAHGLFGVSDVIRAEAYQLAGTRLDTAKNRLTDLGFPPPATEVREGQVAQSILDLIAADHSIVALVLGAGTGKEGPGPLVASLSRNAGQFPVPVILVPGHLTDADLAAIS